jgi:ABC-type uncharacterized transport system permease subunit
LITCLFFALILRYLLAFLLGITTFWTTMPYGQSNAYENFFPLIVGLIFPYSLIPNQTFSNILTLTPWAFMLHHPLQIYLGKYDNLQIF